MRVILIRESNLSDKFQNRREQRFGRFYEKIAEFEKLQFYFSCKIFDGDDADSQNSALNVGRVCNLMQFLW